MAAEAQQHDNDWDTAAARGPATIVMASAVGEFANIINGTFHVVNERSQGAPPVYKRQGDAEWKDWQRDVFLYLSSDNKWVVSDSGKKDAREASGIAVTMAAVADGTLPHETATGAWAVAIGGALVPHPSLIVGASAADAEAAAQRARAAADRRKEEAAQLEREQERRRKDAAHRKTAEGKWDQCAASGPAAIVIKGAVGDNAKYVNGWYAAVPDQRAPGGAPVYRRHAPTKTGDHPWLYLARNNGKWYVSDAGDMRARKASGWARTVSAVAADAPTLPHRAGAWDLDTVVAEAGVNEVPAGDERNDAAGRPLPPGWKRVMADAAAFPGECVYENEHTGARSPRGGPVPTRPAVPAWADALYKACGEGDATTCEALLLGETGATMAQYSTKYGSTPLHAAASLGKAACCKVLLEHPTIFTARDAVNNRDASALDLAEANKHAACVALLREHGVKSGRRELRI